MYLIDNLTFGKYNFSKSVLELIFYKILKLFNMYYLFNK